MMKRKIAWGKGFIAGLAAALLSAAIFSACGANDSIIEEPDVPGLLKEETGSANDYAGWWRLADHSGAAPFACIEIPIDDPGVVNCYDESGNLTDTGYTDYSEQRALNGNALMVLVFENIGEYSVSPFYSGDDKYMDVRDGGEFSGTFEPTDALVPAAAKSDDPATDSIGREKGENTAMLLYQGHASLRITTL